MNILQYIYIFFPIGIDLAKIIVKSILLLENVGVRVEGITSDGATTNRAMWTILGVSGKIDNMRNYIDNPYDGNRKLFIFSDAPHLLKTVRNRLFTKKSLQVKINKYTLIISYTNIYF